MACCGAFHTITLSNDGTLHSFGYSELGQWQLVVEDITITLSNNGTLHSFGKNSEGQLGLGDNNDVCVSIPTPIPNLPKISLVSCGFNFSVCVDCEGFMWSFGENNYGQLGTGNTTSFNTPQKIVRNIPPVHSVSCGAYHTLIITNDDNLWSFGYNDYGQLCLGNKECQINPQKTSFSCISISGGFYHSLFQNNKGEIFACGYNKEGECGLGHYKNTQITPSRILNAPSNIVQFVCGACQSLFLDSEGNVFSVGDNYFGQLGLGHNRKQNVLSKIDNIPTIQTISCAGASSYLIDFEGNLWSFGTNDYGQLGHGIHKKINAPKVISTLSDIRQISHGSTGNQFIAKNSQNQIFVTGNNDCGQLGTGSTCNTQRNKFAIFHHLERGISHASQKCQKINDPRFVFAQ